MIAEERAAELLKSVGCRVKTCQTHKEKIAAPGLLELPRIKRSFYYLNKLITAIDTCIEKSIDPWDDFKFFKISMEGLGAHYASDVECTFTEGTLIEAYDLDRIQVFRNLRFMEMSNYSLLELLSFEWPEMYERSSVITGEMMRYCDEHLWANNRTIRFPIRDHYIREARSSVHQVFKISFQHLSPLYSGPNKPFGFIGSFHCVDVPLADEFTNKIDFL